MRRALPFLLLCAWIHPGPAAAEIYRCVGADGKVRFVGDPAACPGAERHELKREIQRLPAQEQAPPASRGESAALETSFASLEELFLPAREAGSAGHWEVVVEAPEDPSQDPDLRRWGVRDKHVRHYTHRDSSGRVRVCSVELWRFESEERARIARENLSYPNWRFERRGAVMVMLHAVIRERGERAGRGVFSECAALGRRIAARAEGLSQ